MSRQCCWNKSSSAVKSNGGGMPCPSVSLSEWAVLLEPVERCYRKQPSNNGAEPNSAGNSSCGRAMRMPVMSSFAQRCLTPSYVPSQLELARVAAESDQGHYHVCISGGSQCIRVIQFASVRGPLKRATEASTGAA